MSTPRRLDLRACTSDEQACARIERWLAQYRDDALRERASMMLADDDMDVDAIDDAIAADRDVFDRQIASALANTRAHLAARRLSAQLMHVIEAEGLWPLIVARIGTSRDPAVLIACVESVLAEHLRPVAQGST
jgi:hypothetical protein